MWELARNRFTCRFCTYWTHVIIYIYIISHWTSESFGISDANRNCSHLPIFRLVSILSLYDSVQKTTSAELVRSLHPHPPPVSIGSAGDFILHCGRSCLELHSQLERRQRGLQDIQVPADVQPILIHVHSSPYRVGPIHRCQVSFKPNSI